MSKLTEKEINYFNILEAQYELIKDSYSTEELIKFIDDKASEFASGCWKDWE